MRVKLSIINSHKLFDKLDSKNISVKQLSKLTKVSTHTISEWRSAQSTIPANDFTKLIRLAKIYDHSLLQPTFFQDYWHIKSAAKKGAQARYKLYGNPGTLEGRRRGGLNSIATHIANNTKFNNEKKLASFKKTAKLAEFMGILFGDGHLSQYQVSITTNAKTDLHHAQFIQQLIKELFLLDTFTLRKKSENTISVVASSIQLVKALHKLGMPIGNKLTHAITVPDWIVSNNTFQKNFIRGLFDTDGCIYIDRHMYKNKQYTHQGWAITSYAATLRKDILTILYNLKFSPTHRASQKSIFLRKQREIKKYFQTIGTHNIKHARRYQQGRVPKWS